MLVLLILLSTMFGAFAVAATFGFLLGIALIGPMMALGAIGLGAGIVPLYLELRRRDG